MRNRLTPALLALFLLSAAPLALTGCQQDATPKAAYDAGARSEKQAQDAAATAQKRVSEGNAVLDGKTADGK